MTSNSHYTGVKQNISFVSVVSHGGWSYGEGGHRYCADDRLIVGLPWVNATLRDF